MTILISVCVRNSVFIMRNWFAMIENKCEKLWKRYNYVFWILLSSGFKRLVFDEFIAEYKHTCILVLLDHTSHSGDLLLWVDVRRHASFVVRRALTFSSQELLGQSSPNLVCSICRVRRQEIINFMTLHPKGR